MRSEFLTDSDTDYHRGLRLVDYSRLLHGVERGDHRFGGKHDSEINLRVMLSWKKNKLFRWSFSSFYLSYLPYSLSLPALFLIDSWSRPISTKKYSNSSICLFIKDQSLQPGPGGRRAQSRLKSHSLSPIPNVLISLDIIYTLINNPKAYDQVRVSGSDCS